MNPTCIQCPGIPRKDSMLCVDCLARMRRVFIAPGDNIMLGRDSYCDEPVNLKTVKIDTNGYRLYLNATLRLA